MPNYVIRNRRTAKYVAIVDRFPQPRDGEAEATVFSYDDMCEVMGFHLGSPRDHAAIRIDGPLAAMRRALRTLSTRLLRAA